MATVVSDPIAYSATDARLSLAPIGSFETGVFDASAAEIVQAHGDRLYVVNAQAGSVDVLDYRDPQHIVKVTSISSEGVANSIAIRDDGLAAIAFQAVDKTAPGHVIFFDANATTPTELGRVTVGALPDNVVISADGAVALTANEGEPADDFSSDPEGSVSVIALPESVTAPAQADVRTADFHDFEADGSTTLPAGVRVFGPAPHGADKPVSRNLEPEYITVDGGTAYVTLQEANAIAKVDIATAEVTEILPLGTKDHGVAGNGIDPSDRDPNGAPTFNIRSFEGLYGTYMPDGIASYRAGEGTYLVTANEGDAREWGTYVEPARVKDLGKNGLPPVCATSPLAAQTGDANLGRLNVSTADGLSEDGTCYESLHAFGSRSFSIWSADGNQVFDSGEDFERITHEAIPGFFNSNHTEANLEGRSDDKGPEPESVVVGQVGTRTYAFVGLERVGGIMVYDLTDPEAAEFVTYVNNRDFTAGQQTAAAGDLGPEGLAFIPAEDSATGTALLAVGNEVSGSTTLFEIEDQRPEVQIVTVNDFHGRLEAGLANGEVGAAGVAGAVAAHEELNPNTLFVSAGDNIGASTFPSFIQDDTPTIDALTAAGLDVSTVGNHEFDQGFADLKDRVVDRFGGAEFALGANVYERGTQTPALQEFEIKVVDGVRVAFIGTVTEQTASMVSPAGISDIEFGDQVEAANRVANRLAADGLADAIVLLTHDGSADEACSAIATEETEFGDLVRNASPHIDAIVSAHTHQRYACEISGRPVIQADQYGTTLGTVTLAFDRSSNGLELAAAHGDTVSLTKRDGAANVPVYPGSASVAAMVSAAVAEAETLGQVPVGSISADILRGGTNGSDRGVESSLGNLIADVYLWAASNESFAGTKAQIGIMNPGGLRDDLRYGADGTLTYRAVANVQPFANTLVTVQLTGAQLRAVLEEQWQPAGSSRPKLHLGISEGLTYSYDPDAARGAHITEIRFNGARVADTDTFTVVTNSFLAAGGDNFTTFAAGANPTDTGEIDLAATIDYFEAHPKVDPAPLGRAVAGELDALEATPAVTVTTAKSTTRYGQANSLVAKVTADGAPVSGRVDAVLNGKTIARNVPLSAAGTATVKLPATTRPGSWTLTLKYQGTRGVKPGSASTKVRVLKAAPSVSARLSKTKITAKQKGKVAVSVKLPGASGVYASGKIRIMEGKKVLKSVTLSTARKGKVLVNLPKLKTGTHTLRVVLPANSLQGEAKSAQLKLRVR